MTCRCITLLGILLGLAAGAGLSAARADGDLATARCRFVRDRDACALRDAFYGARATDERAATDARLAMLACDASVTPAATSGAGYAALPSLVVALREMDLAAAGEAAERMGKERIGAWMRALVLARRGDDAQAVEELLAPPDPVPLDVEAVLFPLALLGAVLPPDDRLLLAGTAREALLEVCRRGQVDRVVPLARCVAALDSVLGPECICLAARALRRAGRLQEAGALLAGPETADDPVGRTCVQFERVLAAWFEGRAGQARLLAKGLDVGPEAAFVVRAIERASTSPRVAPAPRPPLETPEDHVAAQAVARLATLLGTEASVRSVEVAALAQGLEPADAGFAKTFLESLGHRVLVAAGGREAGEAALAQGLPFLLYRIRPRREAFVDVPVVVRARDPSTGLWMVDPSHLDDLDVLPPDAPLKGRILVAVPAGRGEALESWAPRRQQVLGRTIAAALDRADRGDVDGAIALLEAQRANLDGEPIYHLYLGLLLHRRVRGGQDRLSLDRARASVERSLELGPELAFEHFVRGQSLWFWSFVRGDEEREQALAAFDRAQAAAPRSAWLARTRFQLLRDSGRSGPAVDVLDLARRLDPRDTRALLLGGHHRAVSGDVSGARRDLRRAFDRRSDSPEVAGELWGLELDAGRPDAALAVIMEYIAHVPEAVSDAIVCDARREAERRLVQDAATVEDLEALLSSPLSDTRRRVVLALARIKTAKAEQVLRRVLADPHRAVRVTALRVYMRPWLRERVEADDSLGQRVVVLLKHDPSEIVRGAAAGLLSLIAKRYAAEELEAILIGEERDPDPYPRSEAAAALAHHDSPRARASLVTALSDEDLVVRQAAIAALFRLAFTYRGYDPEAPRGERAAAVERWRVWLREEQE